MGPLSGSRPLGPTRADEWCLRVLPPQCALSSAEPWRLGQEGGQKRSAALNVHSLQITELLPLPGQGLCCAGCPGSCCVSGCFKPCMQKVRCWEWQACRMDRARQGPPRSLQQRSSPRTIRRNGSCSSPSASIVAWMGIRCSASTCPGL